MNCICNFRMQIFLPVGWDDHFYLVVYNKISKAMDIIDYRPLERGKTVATQYMSLRSVALRFLNFIAEKNLGSFKELSTYPPNLLRMPWQDGNINNIADCGVFCMLHMDTFEGDPTWTTGVTPTNARKMVQTMRIQYLSRILHSETNNSRTSLKYKIRKLYNLPKK